MGQGTRMTGQCTVQGALSGGGGVDTGAHVGYACRVRVRMLGTCVGNACRVRTGAHVGYALVRSGMRRSK